MCHVDEGDPQPAVHRFEFELHLLAHFEVECAEGFVEEENFRLVDDGAGDGDALLLSAREGGNAPFFKAFEVYHLQGVFHLFGDFRAGQFYVFGLCSALFVHEGRRGALELEPERHVVEHVEVGEEGIFLKDGIDGALVGGEGADVLGR